MVLLTSPETKNRELPTCKLVLPEQETTESSGRKRTIITKEDDVHDTFHKRLKSSSLQTTNERSLNKNELLISQSICNLLSVRSSLGLQMNNSRSLRDLTQNKIPQDRIKSGSKPPTNKSKASNFPAMRLLIGEWEFVSKNEADLVAKCYFAKHKIVWEVLEGGLKKKIEIEWENIVALKANLPDDGPGSLTIVLDKEPLFFKEIDPQPKKHTVWQPTSDFTDGEASKYRMHHIQCSQGVLNKHYEKLIQCDTRLNFLSQQVAPIMGYPFAAQKSVKNPNVMNNNGLNQQDASKGPLVSCMKNTGPIDLACGYVETLGIVASNATRPVNMPSQQQLMSIPEHRIQEKKHLVLPVYNNISGENNSHFQLNDMRLTTTFDEEWLTSRVNSLSSFLQGGNESNDHSNLDVGDYHPLEWLDGNDDFTPYCNLMPENENGSKLSRVDSLTDFLNQLPDIEPLPSLAFDTL